ncbi:hypothetical protein B0H13DRAFT_2108476 [Mycena leptocephala]|nr:hypothetical protein B0H13DRAFT_2108476 [Mycena leptocephala]
MLRLALRSRRPSRTLNGKTYATISSRYPVRPSTDHLLVVPSELDKVLLASLASKHGLLDLIQQYFERSDHVLRPILPYESRPTDSRRVTFNNGDSVFMIAHCARDHRHKVTVSSGLALAVPSQPNEEPFILTCAHTLEEARALTDGSQAEVSSGSFLVSGAGGSLSIHPISRIVSAIPRSDILLVQSPSPALPTLPVSPYPAQRETAIRAHFVTHERPRNRWVRGSVLGYRDFAGRETEPGSYDSLSHMLFSPSRHQDRAADPLTRMDNRVEGVRGWGVPSETIFEMFSLPGLPQPK